ncbi:hypothetical protein L1987_47560 [Smallanthus sonchifolius]|uniref:Uncharacterized protein n=1 Tax=Smallanthus sonchifolius TaxID=185202 RepID=A0ACB9G2S6_9ASTR|nr:hypothetical protein L1987_47560 [Smallanthus sonchifolius]
MFLFTCLNSQRNSEFYVCGLYETQAHLAGNSESDEDHGESSEELLSNWKLRKLEIEDEASNEEDWTSSGESKSDDEDVEARAAATLRKSVLAVAIFI